MADTSDGRVAIKDVLFVLRKHGVQAKEVGGSYTFIKGDVIEVHTLGETIGRNMLGRLGRKFGIPVHFFFHPEMLGSDTIN